MMMMIKRWAGVLLTAALLAASASGVACGKPLCRNFRDQLGMSVVPRYALGESQGAQLAAEFAQGQALEKSALRRELKDFVKVINEDPSQINACVVRSMYTKATKTGSSWRHFFQEQGLRVRAPPKVVSKAGALKQAETCDMIVIWALKSDNFFRRRTHTSLPHCIIMEEPWFWRHDPTGRNTTWVFLGWDYLNGYALRWNPHPPDRWQKHFEESIPIAPWIAPRDKGYALILGQVPTDTAVVGARVRYESIDAIYKYIVESIQRELPDIPIVYRPHPLLHTSKVRCALAKIKGVKEVPSSKQTLSEALDGANFVVTISSTAAVEAIFRGVPVISLDPIAPVWPVSCHDFKPLKAINKGHACRPDRSQWLADIAYAIWNQQEIRSGEAFEYLFQRKLKSMRSAQDDHGPDHSHHQQQKNETAAASPPAPSNSPARLLQQLVQQQHRIPPPPSQSAHGQSRSESESEIASPPPSAAEEEAEAEAATSATVTIVGKSGNRFDYRVQ